MKSTARRGVFNRIPATLLALPIALTLIAGSAPTQEKQALTQPQIEALRAKYKRTRPPGRPSPNQFITYKKRQLNTLNEIAEGSDVNGAIARFLLNKEIEEANRIIMKTDLDDYSWHDHYTLISLYHMFNADDGTHGTRLSREATEKLQEHFWDTLRRKKQNPWRVFHFLPDEPWWTWGTPNHGFVFQSYFYGVASILKDIPKYAEKFDAERMIGWGQGASPETHPQLADVSLAEYAERGRRFWRKKLQWHARQGLWAEDSVYRCYDIAATYHLAHHAPDPVIRKRAKMLLDLHWLIYAMHMVDDQLGGAMNRYKPHYTGYHFDRGLGHHYFGGRGGRLHSTEVALFGDYVPPQIAYDMLTDQIKRGHFTYHERLTMYNSETGQPPHTYKQSYVTPEYVLGSYILQDLRYEGQHRYSEREFNGITFGKSRAILRLGPAVTFEGYHCMQNGPILVASWYGEKTPYLSILRREGGGANVEQPTIEEGWVFGKAGDAFYAMRPAAGELSIDTPERREELQRFNFPNDQKKNVPIIIHAGGATRHGSFENFKKNILDNHLSYNDGIVSYTDDRWGELRFNPTPAGQLYASNTLSSWSVHSKPYETLLRKGKVASDGEQNYVLWERNNNTVMKSQDSGKTWALFGPEQPEPRDPGYSFAGLHDLEYAFDAFPAASGYRCILTSHENRSASLKNDIPEVLASTGETFAVGTANGKLYTANTWKLNWDNEVTATEDTHQKIPIREMAAGNGRFVAVGHDGNSSAILTFAEDSEKYERITQHRNDGFNDLLLSDVAYSRNQNVFVAAGRSDGSTIVFTSNDGQEWEVKTTINETLLHLEWAPDVFALVTLPNDNATKANAYTSADGNTWSPVEMPPKIAGSMIDSFSSDGHHFFSVVYELDKKLRQVNGEPAPLPDKLFDSPYLTSDYNSGVITAEFGSRKLILDFNNNERRTE